MTDRPALLRALNPVVAIAISAGIAAPWCFDAIGETDAGWHLALGRKLLAEGMFFRNALAWTTPDQPWYPTSWLFDVAGYALVDAIGPLGLQLLIFGLFSLALTGLALALLQVHGSLVWLLPATSLLLAARITERPHMASWAVLAWTAAFCLRAQRTGKWQWRAAAIAVLALGSNLHAGAIFSAGLLGLFCLEELVRTRRLREVGIGLLGLLALLANPGGLFNIAYAIDHLSVQSVIVLNEFLRPSLAEFPAFFVGAPLALIVLAPQAKRRPALLLATLVFAGLGFFASRLVYKFYFVATLAIGAGVLELSRRHARVVWLAPLVMLTGAALATERSSMAFPGPREARFDARLLPVRAADFLTEHGLSDRGFNGFGDGGYLTFAVPGFAAFQDARVQAYPQPFFARLQEAERSPAQFRALLRELDVEWAITTRIRERLGGFSLLHGAPDWSLVYWDEVSEVYVRRDVPRFAELIERYEYRHFRPWGSILGPVLELTGPELARYAAEIDRFEHTSPDFAFSAVVRCALAVRHASGARIEDCDRADQLAGDGPARALLQRALALPPAASLE